MLGKLELDSNMIESDIQWPKTNNGIRIPYELTLVELRKMVEEQKSHDRWCAFTAIASKPEDEALAFLIDATFSRDSRMRALAAEAIQYHKQSRKAIGRLLQLLDDSEPPVQWRACETLAAMHALESHDAIVRLLSAKQNRTRQVALEALDRIWLETDYPAVLHIMQHDKVLALRKDAGWILHNHLSADHWKELLDYWISHSLPRYRVWACEIIAKYGSVEYISLLEALLKDENGHVRRGAQCSIELLKKESDSS
jgi:HEAT repeat protein